MSDLASSRKKCKIMGAHGVKSNQNISIKTGVIYDVEVVTENRL